MKNEDDSLHRPHSHRQLPLCSLSTQCLLYVDRLDRLDGMDRSENTRWTVFEGDEETREEQLIEQLRAHIPTCPTCRAVLADVRRQREAIRHSLFLGEQEVPSTASRIIAATRREAVSTPFPQQFPIDDELRQDEQGVFPRIVETPVPKRRRGTWIDILSVAVAAVLVLATLGILGRFLLLHTTVGSATSSAGSTTNPPVLVPSASWSSVVLTYVLNNKTVIANYDPLNGQSVTLAAFARAQAQVAVDGVAHGGDQVLYHVFDGTQTRYYLYPQTQQPIYTTSGQGGAAIWSSGDSGDSDRYLFISTQQGIAQIDVVGRASHLLSVPLATTQVVFYRNGYLYYVQNTGKTAYSGTGTLYRLTIASSNTSPMPITPCSQASSFWLSPVGSTVYYQCPSQGQNALYSVNGDGTNAHLVRTDAGQMVGYTADNSLIVLQANNGRFQVVQLGANAQQDHILLSDVAPGALSVHQSDVAVAPYGYKLVAKGTYANNVEKLWYSDLMTQGTQQVQLPSGVHDVNAIGWDRLTPTSAPTPSG